MADDRPWKIRRPKDIREYILRRCQEQPYLIFDEKLQTCVCTACDKEISMKETGYMTHCADRKVTMRCPECRAKVVPKNNRYGRKGLTDTGRIVWTRACGPVTFIEVDVFTIDYTMPHPGVWIAPDSQLRLVKKKQERFDWREGYWTPGHWEKVKKIGLKARAHTSYYISAPRIHDHFYWPGLQTGTDLQYMDGYLDRFSDSYWDEHDTISRIIGYLSDFLRYPAVEILDKSGFRTLVENRARGGRTRNLNMNAKDLRKILKVDGADVKALRREDPSIVFLDNLHHIRKHAPWAKVEDVDALSRIMGNYIQEKRWNLINRHADISKLLRRILTERKEKGNHFTLNDYADYLEALKKLGRRIDKRAVYPKDFEEAHDEAMKKAELLGDREKYVNFLVSQISITQMEEPYISGAYMIRPAMSPAELREESQVLNHCVRSYVPKVNKGETSILFIRKTDHPDRPFFTLELNPQGRIVQCRGDHNCSYPEDVKKFIKEWYAWWIIQKKNAKAATAA